MSVQELTTADFESTVGKGVVLVDFWASWCGPCRAFAPVFEKVAAQNPDVTFAKVNTEEEQQLAGELGIQAIPTLMVFKEGVLIFAQAGMLPESSLADLVRQARDLDMAKVREELARQEREAPAE